MSWHLRQSDEDPSKLFVARPNSNLFFSQQLYRPVSYIHSHQYAMSGLTFSICAPRLAKRVMSADFSDSGIVVAMSLSNVGQRIFKEA